MRPFTACVAASVLLLAACVSNPGPREDAKSGPVETSPKPVMSEPLLASEPVVRREPEVTAAPQPTRPVTEQPAATLVQPAEPPARPAPPMKPTPSRAVPTKPSPVAPPSPTKKPVNPVEVGSSAEGTRIEGTVELVAGPGQSLAADEMGQVAVYFVPDSAKASAKPGRYLIYTHNKMFEPESLVIPLGSTVSFPNQDEILHNVFSVTPKSSFDLGVYGEGKSAEYTFKKPGLVLINCNVHHAMQANVLVVDTPYLVSPGKDGRFSLDKLPLGGGKLMIWHPRANVQEQILRLPAAAPIALRLVLSKPRFVEHMNKERKPY